MFWKPGEEMPLNVEDRSSGDVLAVYNPNMRMSLDKQRMSLPVFEHRREFDYCVERFNVVIVVGSTGSGKTTQLPQYLVEGGFGASGMMVAVTQPRRVACVTLAQRVAAEVRDPRTVGYAMRFDDTTTEHTRICYITDGFLVREMMNDPLLSRYSVIMVDEAHERNVYTDILLGLLRKVIPLRPSLRVVVSSATLDAKEFLNFFSFKGSFPTVMCVEGRQYPVDTHYLEEGCSDYVRAAHETVRKINASEAGGDVLVFLTGREEIDSLVDRINGDKARGKGPRLAAVPLYAALPPERQLAAFRRAGQGERKIVVATNVAETSITVPGVKFVVDCGFVKIKWCNPSSGLEALSVVPISRASADQRAGRAGRMQLGKAFRLYTKEAYDRLAEKSQPEIQRADLAAIILQLKALHVFDVVNFGYMSPPPVKAFSRSLELLHCLGALDDESRLTSDVGVVMAEFPSTPQITRMILASPKFGCSEEIIKIAAMCSVKNVFFQPRGKRSTVDQARRYFAVEEGDHISLLNVFNSYLKNKRSSKWCKSFFINHRAMERAVQVRGQLRAYAQRYKIEMCSSGDVDDIRKAVVSGFFANVAQLQPNGTYKSIRGGKVLNIHPDSFTFKAKQPDCVIFGELIETFKVFMRDVTPVDAEWLQEIAPKFYQLGAVDVR